MALALALALANHPDGFSPPLGEAGRGPSFFILHSSFNLQLQIPLRSAHHSQRTCGGPSHCILDS